jgi:hypothetical protein
LKEIDAMRPREDQSPNGSKSSDLRRNIKQFFFETVGGRTYLRFMRLVVILIIGLTVISLASIIILFMLRSQPDNSVPVNVNIIPQPSTPYTPDNPIIRKVPSRSSPPKVDQQPKHRTSVPPPPLMPDNKGNEQSTPKPPSRSSPSESPP